MPKHKFTDIITLGSGHSLIMGHMPGKVTLAQVGNKQVMEKKDTSSLGLFDNSTPNYSTYYPDVTAEDLNPQDADFINPTFRMLSETVVHRNWNPIDFSKKGVLKKAMKMLVGQTVNIDHETALGNAIGSVVSVSWNESYKTDDGVTIPAGINAELKIDGKSNPRIARGILMDPPSIHSNSVTVAFSWEMSHPSMDQGDFWSKLGTFDSEGELIRRVVTEIHSFHETSLVAHGADPYAQIVGSNGEINNPIYANGQASLSADQKKEAKAFHFDFKDQTSLTANRKPTEEETLNNKNIKMKELLEKLSKVVNFAPTEGEEITEANLTAHLVNLASATDTANTEKDTALAEKVTAETALTEKETEITGLTTKVTELETFKEVGETALNNQRAEAVRLYNLATGEDADEAILAVINKSDFGTASSFIKQYEKQVDESFTATCKDCNSTNVSMASASTDEGDEGDDKNKPSYKSNDESFKNLQKKKRFKVSAMHGETEE